jgi:hypothetical protein
VPAGPNAPQLVFITDPVAGASYVLDANKKTARKVPLGQGVAQGATMIASGVGQPPVQEALGNERPISTVTERWYSSQLQATVLSTTNDPMMGQGVHRLTNINLAEPAPSLFEVPADYTLSEGPMVRHQVK